MKKLMITLPMTLFSRRKPANNIWKLENIRQVKLYFRFSKALMQSKLICFWNRLKNRLFEKLTIPGPV